MVHHTPCNRSFYYCSLFIKIALDFSLLMNTAVGIIYTHIPLPPFIFFKGFIYLFQRERKRGKEQRERDKPDVRFDPGTLGS